MEDYYFRTVEQGLAWSLDTLRRRRFAKISSVYKEMEREDTEADEDMASGVHSASECYLPSMAEDALSLALAVQDILIHVCSEDELNMIYLFYLGDYANEKRYRTAQAFQEKLRSEGKRVRLCFSYSYRQLGSALGVDHKTAKRRLDKVHQVILKALEEKNLLSSKYGRVA